jgi:hypothetical protein
LQVNLWHFVKRWTWQLFGLGYCVLACFGGSGCDTVRNDSLTAKLWHDTSFVVPSPDPKLAISQTPKGILVQYDAVSERSGEIKRHAYLLEPNLGRIAKRQKPVFTDPAKAGPRLAIPIFTKTIPGPARPEMYVVCSTNFSTFSIYSGKLSLGPCDLPVFNDRSTAKELALTPLAVTGDASVIAAVLGYWYVASNPGQVFTITP